MWKASLLQHQLAACGAAESVALVAYPSLDTSVASGWRLLYSLLTTSAQQQAAYESRDKLNIQNFYTITVTVFLAKFMASLLLESKNISINESFDACNAACNSTESPY